MFWVQRKNCWKSLLSIATYFARQSECFLSRKGWGWFHLVTFRIHDRFTLKHQISYGSSGFILGLNFLLTKTQCLSWLHEKRQSFNKMTSWHGYKWWDVLFFESFFLTSRSEQSVEGDYTVAWWGLKVLATLVLEAHMSNRTKSQSFRSYCILIHQTKKRKLQRFLRVLRRIMGVILIALFTFGLFKLKKIKKKLEKKSKAVLILLDI